MTPPLHRRNRRVNVAVRVSRHKVLSDLFRLFKGVDFVSLPSGGGPVRLTGNPGASVAYLAEEVLSKYDDGKAGTAKLEACLKKWQEAEDICSETNHRLPNDFRGATRHTGLRSMVERAARKIDWLLGDFDWDECLLGVGFGPGATTRLGRARSDLSEKFGGIPHTTLGCAGLAHAYLEREAPLWRSSVGPDAWDIVPGNRVTTVPKNYKTDRAIAVEPCWNIFFQKGIGSMIRKRLRRVNINLNDQTPNQVAALRGSRDGSLATLDLSMASDTVSRAIVELLIPLQWRSALEQVRSAMGSLPSGELVTYQKFSSMGNGFTFELESLIFWALMSTCVEAHGGDGRSVLVYGDDLVVPSSCAEPCMALLEFCGFSVNEKKSHWQGDFRESCGKHYLGGADISPFYIRESVSSLDRLFLLYNNIYRWLLLPAVQKEMVSFDKTRLFLARLRSHAPRSWRQPRLPVYGYGDGAFVGTFDEARPRQIPAGSRKRKHAGWEGYFIDKTLQWRRRQLSREGSFGVLLSSLWLIDRVPPDAEWTAVPHWERSWGVHPLWVRSWTREDPIWSSPFRELTVEGS